MGTIVKSALLLSLIGSIYGYLPINNLGQDFEIKIPRILKEKRFLGAGRLGFTSRETKSTFRLPDTILPLHYDIQIVPLLESNTGLGRQWTAPGTVRIRTECVKKTSEIRLNAFLINVTDVKVQKTYSKEIIAVDGHEPDALHTDVYHVRTNSSLEPGQKYDLVFSFIAPVSINRADGLYRSSYKNEAGETKYLASTQFEAFNARQMFPCFDEPALKATFDMTIGRRENYSSIANTELLETRRMEGVDGWFWDEFSTTVLMPTYLLALVVSDFEYAEANRELFHGKPVRVYGPPKIIGQNGGIFGADAGARILSFYEDYFKIDYPLSKMDSAMIPGFQYGAMENYGLNIYREKYLMHIPGSSLEYNRASVASIIAHELGHQWFGNLVTCKWWNNIWLNEGFATYYSYLAVNSTYPEFQADNGLVSEILQTSFRYDERPSTYSLLLDAESQEELENRVAGIPYVKGASMIRMMNAFLTPQTFKTGIQKYLRHWAYKAVNQDDLFSILTVRAHADGTIPRKFTVKEIMDTWTKQKGFPVIKVYSVNESVYFVQEKYGGTHQDNGTTWYVPLSIATEDNPNFDNHRPQIWMKKGVILRAIKHDPSKWIIVNPDATHYYRVLYDKNLTKLILNQLRNDHSVISPFSRSQMMDDYFNFAFKKHVPFNTSLEFTRYMTNETQEVVWDVFLGYMMKLYDFYDGSVKFQGFKNYIVPRLESVLHSMGIEQKPEDKGAKILFRAKVLKWACRFDYSPCSEYAVKLLDEWKNSSEVEANPNPVPLDMRSFLYCAAVKAQSDNVVFVYAMSLNESSPSERFRLLNSMGCISDPGLLKNLLNSLIDKQELFTREDAVVVMQGVAGNPIGRPILIDFLRTNMKELKAFFNATTPIAHVLYSIGRHAHTQGQLNEIKQMISDNEKLLESVRFYLDAYVGEIRSNINWISKHYDSMRDWFDTQSLFV